MNNQRIDYINRIEENGYAFVRTPLVLIIDISWSMEAIREILNKAITELFQQMKKNELLYKTIDLLVVHFNGLSDIVVDFTPLEEVKISDITINKCTGCTDTGKAIIKALKRAYEYRDEIFEVSDGLITHNQPLVFLLTDGIPDAGKRTEDDTDEVYQAEVDAVNHAYQEAATYIKEKENNQKIVFVAAGIHHPGKTNIPGSNVSEEKLRELTNYPDRVITFEGNQTNFDVFFDLVHKGTTVVDPNEFFSGSDFTKQQ